MSLANMEATRLTNASLNGTNLSGAHSIQAFMNGTDLSNVITDSNTKIFTYAYEPGASSFTGNASGIVNPHGMSVADAMAEVRGAREAAERVLSEALSSRTAFETLSDAVRKMGDVAGTAGKAMPVVGAAFAIPGVVGSANAAYQAYQEGTMPEAATAEYLAMTAAFLAGEFGDPTQLGGSLVVDEWFADFAERYGASEDNPHGLSPEQIEALRPETLTSDIAQALHSNGQTPEQNLFNAYLDGLPADASEGMPPSLQKMIALNNEVIHAEANLLAERTKIIPDMVAQNEAARNLDDAQASLMEEFDNMDLGEMASHIVAMGDPSLQEYFMAIMPQDTSAQLAAALPSFEGEGATYDGDPAIVAEVEGLTVNPELIAIEPEPNNPHEPTGPHVSTPGLTG